MNRNKVTKLSKATERNEVNKDCKLTKCNAGIKEKFTTKEDKVKESLFTNSLTTMKLLILACLVAFTLARPKLPLRWPELIRSEQDSSSSEEVLKEKKFLKFALPTPEELREEYINELNRCFSNKINSQKHYIGSESWDKYKSVSHKTKAAYVFIFLKEVVPSKIEHTPKEDMLSQCYLEQLCRMNQYNLLQLQAVPVQRQPLRVMNQEQAHFYLEPFQQFYKLDAYPTGARYYPLQIMPFIPLQPFSNVAKPIAPENVENTGIMPEW
ncbi:alpha-S1-casein [Dugong dugon]